MTNHHETTDSPNPQALLNEIVLEYMRDQKRTRVWRWVKRGMYLMVIFVITIWLLAQRDDDAVARSKPHVGSIDIKGTIADTQSASADNLNEGLKNAYSNKTMKALVLAIDSPGGSPVQADNMYQAIQYYRNKYPEVKVYAVCGEMCTSAAYYVAAAADEIYANQSSIIGSIGVLYNGFGFVDTLQKVGMTRRLITAGRNKGFLDQFSPMDPGQQQLLQTMLDVIHQRFIEQVKAGRGSRLHIDDNTFSGLFWTGAQARDLGLIDGFSSEIELARTVINLEQIVDYTNKENLIDHVTKNMGATMINQIPKALGLNSIIH